MALRRTMALAMGVLVGVLVVGKLVSGQCVVLADPALPGHTYDLSGLVKNDSDYVALWNTTHAYTMQFCRDSLVLPPAPNCEGAMVCERFSTTYNPVGRAPTVLRVNEPGQIQMNYTSGAITFTLVLFICDPQYPVDPNINVLTVAGPVVMTVFTAFACSIPPPSTDPPFTLEPPAGPDDGPNGGVIAAAVLIPLIVVGLGGLFWWWRARNAGVGGVAYQQVN